MDDMNKKIIDILVENFGLDQDKVMSNNTLEALGVDSIIIIEIQLDLERAFDITIPDGDIPAKFTLNDIILYLNVRINNYAA